jgi:hypothetical protein
MTRTFAANELVVPKPLIFIAIHFSGCIFPDITGRFSIGKYLGGKGIVLQRRTITPGISMPQRDK